MGYDLITTRTVAAAPSAKAEGVPIAEPAPVGITTFEAVTHHTWLRLFSVSNRPGYLILLG